MLTVAKSRMDTKVSQLISGLLLLGSVALLIADSVLNQHTSLYAWLFLAFCLFLFFLLLVLISSVFQFLWAIDLNNLRIFYHYKPE